MELDELKQTWKQTPIKPNNNTDIMELIQHKSYGPIEAMKSSFKRQMIMMLILPFVLVMTNLNNIQGVFSSIIFWSYVVFCMGIVIFSYANYRTLLKMDKMDGMVKSNLEQQINSIEKRLKWNITALPIVTIFFITLVEIVPYFQHYRTLEFWHSISPVARYITYALLLVLQYFMSRRVSQRKFGDHLVYLKELVTEMKS
ncbi:MAG: hypothetical protein ABJB16_13445 [Saprospiraceae bacterium]